MMYKVASQMTYTDLKRPIDPLGDNKGVHLRSMHILGVKTKTFAIFHRE